MKIKILNSSLVEQGTIEETISANEREGLNSFKDLQFETFLTPGNTGMIADGNIAEVNGDYYDLAYFKKDQKEDGSLDLYVEFEHVSYRLNESDYDLEYFAETGDPDYVLGKILEGTGFTVGTVEFEDQITFSIQEKSSRRKMLMEFVSLLSGEVDFERFEVSILTHRGSEVPKNITEGKNFTIIAVTFDKRQKDSNGNPLVSYECKLINPMEINLGDAVTMQYETLSIDTSLRVVSISKNPYNEQDVEFEIGNFNPTLENDTYRIETGSIKKDKYYHGTRIGPEYGFESIRFDKLARAFFNSDAFKMQSGDGSGGNWVDCLYFDPVQKKYIFNGVLTATAIESIRANIQTIVNTTVIVQNLYSDYGRIANLTVSELNTGWKKIINYLASSTEDVNYIRAFEQSIRLYTASTDGTASVQLTDMIGNNLYWIDEEHKGMTSDETDYPVMVYVYTEIKKGDITFLNVEGDYIVDIELGAGVGNPSHPDWGKAHIRKDTEGLLLKYTTSTGTERKIHLTEDNMQGIENIDDQNTTTGVGQVKVWTGTAAEYAALTPESNTLYFVKP